MTLIYRNRSRQTFSRSHGQLRCDWLIHCSCVMREKTPGGSAPSPSAALRPSVRRAWASAVRDWKERGSVMDRSHSTRLFSATLHFSRLCMSAGYFMCCSLLAAATRWIHSCLMLRRLAFRALLA